MNILPQPKTEGRLIGYARVSTTDQKLRMQIDALEGMNCDVIFSDHGVSGSHSQRRGLIDMLATIKTGDTVVVYKLDRLGRSVLQLANLLVRFNDEGIHFCSLSEGINTTTSGGKLVYHLFSAFAEFQRDIIVENTLEGLRAAKKRGSVMGRPRSLSNRSVVRAHKLISQDGFNRRYIAGNLGVSRVTLDRAIDRLDLKVAA